MPLLGLAAWFLWLLLLACIAAAAIAATAAIGSSLVVLPTATALRWRRGEWPPWTVRIATYTVWALAYTALLGGFVLLVALS